MRRHYQFVGWFIACIASWQIRPISSAFAEVPFSPFKEAQIDSDSDSYWKAPSEDSEPQKNTKEKSQDDPASGQDQETSDESSQSLAKKLEDLGKLKIRKNHPSIQEWWFLGRYHGQYYNADGDAHQDDWENRRFRIGSQATMFEKMTLHSQMVSGPDMSTFYNGFTELWSQWAFEDYFVLTVGQQKHRFTHDRNISSRYINTLERSMLVNMFNADYTPSVTLSGNTEPFAYYAGVFSNATGPDMWEAFTEFNSGYSLLASGTWDVQHRFDLDEAFVNFCYLYSDANQNATNLDRFKNGFSAALILTEGPTSLVSEALLGTGSANGNAFGINIQPGYFFTDKLQLATRYQLAISDDPNGLVPQFQYEQPAGMDHGDLYQAGYAGFNYYIAGHRIKLMNGIEYANMNGQDVWTASIAFRIFWGPHSDGPFPMAKTLQSRH